MQGAVMKGGCAVGCPTGSLDEKRIATVEGDVCKSRVALRTTTSFRYHLPERDEGKRPGAGRFRVDGGAPFR